MSNLILINKSLIDLESISYILFDRFYYENNNYKLNIIINSNTKLEFDLYNLKNFENFFTKLECKSNYIIQIISGIYVNINKIISLDFNINNDLNYLNIIWKDKDIQKTFIVEELISDDTLNNILLGLEHRTERSYNDFPRF